MAKNKIRFNDADFDQVADEVIETLLSDEVERKYARYTYYTIGDRALVNVVDGLKPVQRRILYSMYKSNLTPKRPHTKCQRIVGNTMGDFHPHGDASIYDALVRLAQDFTYPVPLIDGQGNFGASGIGAAAPRYTEARLSVFGHLMTSELDEKVVEMMDNYDNTTVEPVVMPTQIPTLLINGTSGIAVAMASNMAPHNPREAMEASIYQLRHQHEWEAIKAATGDPTAHAEATKKMVDNLMKIIPGPDFPTGGLIFGIEGAREAYETGSGKINIRAQHKIELGERGKKKIIFYEFPYGVSPTSVYKHLSENEEKYMKSKRILKENGGKGKVEGFQIEGILSVDDFADAEHTSQLVVVVDAKTKVEVVLAELLKRTALETSFNFNNNCLVAGRPKVVTLPEMLQHFINSRRKVTKARADNELEKRTARRHILEGLLKLLADIDAAIAIIRNAQDQPTASAKLMKKFKIDEVQAKYILDTQLRRLTKYDSVELKSESKDIEKKIVELQRISTDSVYRDKIIDKELNAILESFKNEDADKTGYSTERKSVIVGGTLAEHIQSQKAALAMDREVSDEEVHLMLDGNGHVVQNGAHAVTTIKTTSLGIFYAITNQGRGFRINTLDISKDWSALGLHSGEKIVVISDGENPVMLGTKRGVAYALAPNYPNRYNEFPVMDLAKDDEIIGGRVMKEGEEYVLSFITSDSSLLTFDASKVAVKASLNGKGMAGIKLGESDVLAFNVLNADEAKKAVVVTSTGASIKTTPLSEYPQKGRGTGGVRSHKFLKTESGLVSAIASVSPVALNKKGTKIKLPDSNAKRDASGLKFDLPIERFEHGVDK